MLRRVARFIRSGVRRAVAVVHPNVVPADRKRHTFAAQIIVRAPLVSVSFSSDKLILGLASALGPELRKRDAVFLVGRSWNLEGPRRAAEVATAVKRYEQYYRRHHIHLLCNSQTETELLTAAGARASLINSNIAARGDVFRPRPDVARRYDAVYVARMTPWKRAMLARDIPTVAHVFEREASMDWRETLKYRAECMAAMPGHSFLNSIGYRQFDKLSAEAVNRVLNEAAVGLCLSEVEGAMFASMEYLLAGLPIVSTTSRGGRDHFFDPEFCLVVPPDPRAIAEAVAELIERNVPREHVREVTRQKVRKARGELLEIARSYSGGAGDLDEVTVDSEEFFGRLYRWNLPTAMTADVLGQIRRK